MAPLCTCSGRAWCNYCFWTKSIGFTPEGSENALRNLVESLKPATVRSEYRDWIWCWTRSQTAMRVGDMDWIEVVWPTL